MPMISGQGLVNPLLLFCLIYSGLLNCGFVKQPPEHTQRLIRAIVDDKKWSPFNLRS